MDIDLKQIGKRICELRQKAGITQEKLSELMDVSIQMISNMERGNKAVKISNLLKLSEIFGVSTDYILTGKEISPNADLTAKISCLDASDKKLIEELADRLIYGSEKSNK